MEISFGPKDNGINAFFGTKIYCIASEPHSSFLRISVTDDGREVAYETAILGKLLRGHRVFQLRSRNGTRIELCYLFVCITCGSVPNQFAAPRQVPLHVAVDCRPSAAAKKRLAALCRSECGAR
eukprot:2990940-Prymnesium_polylepis.1